MKESLAKYLMPTLISVCAVFAPIKGAIITVGVVIFVDLVTGIMAARKRGEVITSAAFRRTISKALIYQTALLTGFLIEKYLMNGIVPMTKLITGIVGSVESLSVYENLNTISGNNLFKSLINILGSKNDSNSSEDKPK